MREINGDDLVDLNGAGELFILTKDSTSYRLNETSYRVSNDTIYCWNGRVKKFKDSGFKKSSNIVIAMPSIERVNHDEINPVTTSILIAGTLIIVTGIIVTVYFIVELNNQ